MTFQAELAAYIAAKPETFKTAEYRSRTEQALSATRRDLARATRGLEKFWDKALVESCQAHIAKLETELANW